MLVLYIFQKVKEALVQERDRLYKLLKEVPFLNPFPSHSNFILCEVTSGVDAKKLKVNNFFAPRVHDWLYSNMEIRIRTGKEFITCMCYE